MNVRFLAGVAVRVSRQLLATTLLTFMLVAGGIAHAGTCADSLGHVRPRSYGVAIKQSKTYGNPKGDWYFTCLKFDMDYGTWSGWIVSSPSPNTLESDTLVLWQCKPDGTNCSVKHATNATHFGSDELGYVDTSKGWAYKVCGSVDFSDGSSGVNYCTDLIGYPI